MVINQALHYLIGHANINYSLYNKANQNHKGFGRFDYFDKYKTMTMTMTMTIQDKGFC